MSFILIRHGQTAGNLEGRYIGTTDEPLCATGIAALCARSYPPVRSVYVSPMKRCVESALLCYPQHQPIIIPDFRECDFGAFEGRNYRELSGDPRYQAWIDSNGELPFPNGESRSAFAARCVSAFKHVMTGLADGDDALVVHGGTIMAIMAAFAKPQRPYFDWQVGNGEGFILSTDGAWSSLFADSESERRSF